MSGFAGNKTGCRRRWLGLLPSFFRDPCGDAGFNIPADLPVAGGFDFGQNPGAAGAFEPYGGAGVRHMQSVGEVLSTDDVEGIAADAVAHGFAFMVQVGDVGDGRDVRVAGQWWLGERLLEFGVAGEPAFKLQVVESVGDAVVAPLQVVKCAAVAGQGRRTFLLQLPCHHLHVAQGVFCLPELRFVHGRQGIAHGHVAQQGIVPQQQEALPRKCPVVAEFSAESGVVQGLDELVAVGACPGFQGEFPQGSEGAFDGGQPQFAGQLLTGAVQGVLEIAEPGVQAHGALTPQPQQQGSGVQQAAGIVAVAGKLKQQEAVGAWNLKEFLPGFGEGVAPWLGLGVPKQFGYEGQFAWLHLLGAFVGGAHTVACRRGVKAEGLHAHFPQELRAHLQVLVLFIPVQFGFAGHVR